MLSKISLKKLIEDCRRNSEERSLYQIILYLWQTQDKVIDNQCRPKGLYYVLSATEGPNKYHWISRGLILKLLQVIEGGVKTLWKHFVAFDFQHEDVLGKENKHQLLYAHFNILESCTDCCVVVPTKAHSHINRSKDSLND